MPQRILEKAWSFVIQTHRKRITVSSSFILLKKWKNQHLLLLQLMTQPEVHTEMEFDLTSAFENVEEMEKYCKEYAFEAGFSKRRS